MKIGHRDVETVECSMPVEVSSAFTCAPATEASEGSVTVPLMAPRNVCAFVFSATRPNKIAAKNILFRIKLPTPVACHRLDTRMLETPILTPLR